MLTSLLDNDFYKFTMQHAVIKLFPEAKAKYQFINRGKHQFPPGFDRLLRNAIDQLAYLQLTSQEKNYLKQTCPYLDPVYLDFLEGFRYNPNEVTIKQSGADLEVYIEGAWYRTILWEVVIMSLICELYYAATGQSEINEAIVTQQAIDKLKLYQDLDVKIAEFGTRRRHSYKVHDIVVKALSTDKQHTFMGTSNVHLAMQYNTKPIGTHAHEWFMFHAAKYGYKMANDIALSNWVKVYRGDLGIALSDTYTTATFLQQFDKMYAKLFDGVRHDSGDPITFASNVIAHYEKLQIAPTAKTIIFSDGLNYEKVAAIAAFCKGKIGMSFGIGTNLTNDVGYQPMNIVLKMTEAQPFHQGWTPVVKLSDEPNKHTGTPEAIALSKAILGL